MEVADEANWVSMSTGGTPKTPGWSWLGHGAASVSWGGGSGLGPEGGTSEAEAAS